MTTADPTYRFDDYPLIYTLCFLYRDDEVLMLLRNKPPNAGLWNGVGGHLENGESPHSGCLREVQEETGYCLARANFRGVLTWHSYEVPDGGLYIFSARAPQYEPVKTSEGQLSWKKRDWIFSDEKVVSNIHMNLLKPVKANSHGRNAIGYSVMKRLSVIFTGSALTYLKTICHVSIILIMMAVKSNPTGATNYLKPWFGIVPFTFNACC